MALNLQRMYNFGFNVPPPPGEYAVIIDGYHLLTKKIGNDNTGQNFFPWLAKFPLLPWKRFVRQYGLVTGDFHITRNIAQKCYDFIYEDGITVDHVRQVWGMDNTWVGELIRDGKSVLWFLLEKT